MRKEFSKAVKVAALKRAQMHCEECGLALKTGGFAFDHINPDGLTGTPTLENCKVLCRDCHAEKTKQDVAHIAKAKRREVRELGIKDTPKMQSRGFPKSRKVRVEKTRVPRRALYKAA